MTELLKPGTILGGEFEIVRLIGSGGMGAVYEANQKSTGAARAVKTMHAHLASDPTFRARFEQEARVVAKIRSDHVTQVLGAGVDDASGVPWIALELLHGVTLGDHRKNVGAMPAADVAEIYAQITHALRAAHRAGIIHRDLKPENIFLAEERRAGARWTVKVLDFGIAKLLAASAQSTAALGTPMWMSPEQASRGGTVSPATDIWSMGLIVFDALTGKAYWRSAHEENASTTALLTEILVHELDPASKRAREYGASVPDGFDGWFAQCVARDPLKRFQDVTQALAALMKVLRTEGHGAHTDTMPHGLAEVSAAIRPPGALTADVFANTNPVPFAAPQRVTRARVLIAGASVMILGVAGVLAMRVRAPQTIAPIAPSATSAPSASTPSASAGASHSPAAPPPPPENDMIAIAGATFEMGNNNGAYDEKPVHDVTVASFMLDVVPVTAARYRACVKSGACTATVPRAQCNVDVPERAEHPINCVSYPQARAYCAYVGKRLPTEEEWELAARGRAKRSYPWGEVAPNSSLLCWAKSQKNDTTCPVGSFPSGATPEGLLDMAGNVWEWTSTPYCSYANTACNEERRVTRGGAFASTDPVIVRTTTRIGQEPTTTGTTIGFRCARVR